MEIVPLCPFEAGAFLWEAAPGQPSLTIVVKGTFTLSPGDLRVAPAQDPLAEERHFEDSARASLYWPGDFAPVKRKVDVTLVGHAYAPGGRPVDALVARLAVGDFTKSVQVFGDRVWTRDSGLQLVPSAPAPFVRMPLRYERAALSTDNPIGVDRGLPAATGKPALPNLEHVDGPGMPCFGPVSPEWRSRRRVLDEAATFWAYGVARAPREGAPPVGTAPPRFDFTFFNAAPPDQQIDLLRPGAPLLLENLHPEHPLFAARVPMMRPQVFRVPPSSTGKARVEEIILRCDALWIDTDRGVLVLVWRGVADVTGGAAGVGTLVVDADPEGKKLRWDRVEKRFAEVRPPTLRLPSGGMPSAPQSARKPMPVGPDPLAVRYDGVSRMRPPDPVRTGTLTEAFIVDGGVAPMSIAPQSVGDEPTNPLDPPTEDRAAPIAEPPRRAPRAARQDTKTVEVEKPRPAAPSKTAPPVHDRPPPPRPLMVLGSAPPPRPVAGKPPPPVEGPSALASKPAPRPTGVPSLRKDLGVEGYGTICAELAHKGADRAAVLKARLLTEPAWALVDQQWKRAIAQETEEGGRALLLAFDEAYLAAQQRLGTPIGVREYARIQVGIERGEVGRVLGELSLELGDLMRLQRVWTKRLADAPDLAAELARAVEDARRGAV